MIATTESRPAGPLSADLLQKMHAYWRAANYLSVGQIYLRDNPLMKRPLEAGDIKRLLLGHWGTTPGQNFIYVHLNRIIKAYDLNMIYVCLLYTSYGGNTQSWTLSLSNYYSMLASVKAQAIVTINYAYARYGTGPDPVAAAAHLAADWVRYDNGRTKYWEIGNEEYGNWEAGWEINAALNQDNQPQFITGALYGQHWNVFADSMRAAAQQTGATIYICLLYTSRCV